MIWLRLLLKGSNKNTFDNNYFNDSCPGIPIWRYTQIIFTATIDEYYDYCYGELNMDD